MKRVIGLVLIVVFLTGCTTSTGLLEKGAALGSPDESAFVIGVSPAQYRIFVFPGSLKDEKFHQDPGRNAVFGGHPDEGFVVGKAEEGDTLAIMSVVAAKEKGATGGTVFRPCGPAKTLVFTVPSGKVLYLGHVTYELSGNRVGVQFNSNIESAKRHLMKNYPALAGQLEQGKFDMRHTTCR